jgi:putative heme transporter
VIAVAGSWDKVQDIAPWWLAGMFVLQSATFACIWALQHETLHARAWSPIVTSQLSSNAIAKVAPGGGAVGAALQYRMLVESGLESSRVIGGLTIANLLLLAAVLAMPLLAIPAIIRGLVPHDLVNVTLMGAGVFVLLAGLGAWCLASDEPLRWIGGVVQRVRNRIRRNSEPLTELPARLLRERDRILQTLGTHWKGALLATVGRWTFDYLTLLAALAAVGSTPRASLVLLAFCAAQLLAQIPLTPGGLGFVEAGLTGMLTLAGVSAGDAVLATFAYRLFSYWLPLPAGVIGYVAHRRAVAA